MPGGPANRNAEADGFHRAVLSDQLRQRLQRFRSLEIKLVRVASSIERIRCQGVDGGHLLLRFRFDRRHVGVREAEMVPNFMNQHVTHELFQILPRLAPIVEQRPAI